MHLTLVRSKRGDAVVHVTPWYTIGNRDHGSYNERAVRLEPGRNEVLLDAGDPEGTKGQSRLTTARPASIATDAQQRV
jgi:hypothetical protein